jgi:hypothetical protein
MFSTTNLKLDGCVTHITKIYHMISRGVRCVCVVLTSDIPATAPAVNWCLNGTVSAFALVPLTVFAIISANWNLMFARQYLEVLHSIVIP